MGKPVVNGSLIECDKSTMCPPNTPVPSFVPGAAMPIQVTPINRVNAGGVPIANEIDALPGSNIPMFFACQSMTNPTVVAACATAAASTMGAMQKAAAQCLFTPMPPGKWTTGCKKCKIGGQAVLDESGELKCMMGGTIKIKKNLFTGANGQVECS
ncbi:MAG: DUF4280 domain-containing protein [Candidatus Improbicoccus devescovinae]|nr:MAG: DUF4280 domain-containing protein [Candidatus Improbicoccus devescovinae]